MMFFRYNKQDRPISQEDLDNNSIFQFFQKKEKEELLSLVNELSSDAKILFEGSLQALLGQMPEDLLQAHYSLSKESLQQLIFSSMVTGYLAKAAENKISLEECWNSNKKEKDAYSIDKQIKAFSEEDDMKGIL